MYSTPCIIFAGGKSSRMGEDKALLPFAGYNSLTHYQYDRLSKIFSTVYISCKDKSKFDFDANFLEDIKTDAVFAPTVGFVTAFRNLKSDKFFALSIDTPFITQQEIAKLFEADKPTYDATVAKTEDGVHPLCGIYHTSLQKNFEQMLQTQNHKLGQLLKNTHTKYLFFSQTQPFLNLNHPHQYQEALKIIRNY